MALAITPLHPHIGAAVSGLDVSRRIDDSAVAALWQAIDSHAVLVFRDQQLTDEQLRSFAARFGELEIGRSAARGGRRRLQFPEIGDISTLDEDNRLRARDDQRRRASAGCAAIPAPAANAGTCRRMLRTSSAGRCRKAACCFTTSAISRPSRNSSTAINGGSAIS